MSRKNLALQGYRFVLFMLVFAFHTCVFSDITQMQIYRKVIMGGGGV